MKIQESEFARLRNKAFFIEKKLGILSPDQNYINLSVPITSSDAYMLNITGSVLELGINRADKASEINSYGTYSSCSLMLHNYSIVADSFTSIGFTVSSANYLGAKISLIRKAGGGLGDLQFSLKPDSSGVSDNTIQTLILRGSTGNVEVSRGDLFVTGSVTASSGVSISGSFLSNNSIIDLTSSNDIILNSRSGHIYLDSGAGLLGGGKGKNIYIEAGAGGFNTNGSGGDGGDIYLSAGLQGTGNSGSPSIGKIITNSDIKFPSGYGIDFSNTTNGSGVVKSELLNDYEEGTWTPFLSSTGATFTYSTPREGFYTKIGNVVFYKGVLKISNRTGTLTNPLYLDGLPFNSANTESGYSPGYCSYIENLTPTVYSIWTEVTKNDNRLLIKYVSGSAGTQDPGALNLKASDVQATFLIAFAGFYPVS